jgi:hypothetical protein
VVQLIEEQEQRVLLTSYEPVQLMQEDAVRVALEEGNRRRMT